MDEPNTHPWLVPPSDAGDDTDDVGDPRDFTVPGVRRGGMTVVDETAWRAAINERMASHGEAGDLAYADGVATNIERAIHIGGEPEIMFLASPFGLEGGARTQGILGPWAAVLRDHWAWGPRFWAWWQARQPEAKPARADVGWSALNPHEPGRCGEERCREPAWWARVGGGRGEWHYCAEHAKRQAGLDGHALPQPMEAKRFYAPDKSAWEVPIDNTTLYRDPRPVLRLASGETVRADLLLQRKPGPEYLGWCQRLAVGGGTKLAQLANGQWHDVGQTGDWSEQEALGAFERVYPPAEAKAATVNAHGVDVGKIAIGDYVHSAGDKQWLCVARISRPGHGSPLGHIESPKDRPERHSGWCLCLEDVDRHRAAPRITLPDGREVAVERMWRSERRRLSWANAAHGSWAKFDSEPAWAEYGREPLPDSHMNPSRGEERVWPPAEVEP